MCVASYDGLYVVVKRKLVVLWKVMRPCFFLLAHNMSSLVSSLPQTCLLAQSRASIHCLTQRRAWFNLLFAVHSKLDHPAIFNSYGEAAHILLVFSVA
jgi:hypothetical protein